MKFPCFGIFFVLLLYRKCLDFLYDYLCVFFIDILNSEYGLRFEYNNIVLCGS